VSGRAGANRRNVAGGGGRGGFAGGSAGSGGRGRQDAREWAGKGGRADRRSRTTDRELAARAAAAAAARTTPGTGGKPGDGAKAGTKPGAKASDGQRADSGAGRLRRILDRVRWSDNRVRVATAGALGFAVLTAVVLVVTVGGSGGHSGASADQSAAQSASASPSASTPDEPGRFGRPSLPGKDPFDQWPGARPIDGIDPPAFRKALTDAWGLEFTSRRLLGGLRWNGLGGDRTRHQRRLDAIIETTNSDLDAFEVMCQAGGTDVTPNDETSLKFVPECLAKAVPAKDLDMLRTWLDQNLKTMAENGGSTWYQLPSMRMYVESNRHVISCALVNT
jgi:hypothetical protein